MNAYEAVAIFSDKLKDEALEQAVGAVKAEIEKQNGTVKSTTRLGKRQFARRLGGRDAGQYFLLTFDLTPNAIPALHARYKLLDNVFRVQIVRIPEDAAPAGPSTGTEQKPDSGPQARAGKEEPGKGATDGGDA